MSSEHTPWGEKNSPAPAVSGKYGKDPVGWQSCGGRAWPASSTIFKYSSSSFWVKKGGAVNAL